MCSLRDGSHHLSKKDKLIEKLNKIDYVIDSEIEDDILLIRKERNNNWEFFIKRENKRRNYVLEILSFEKKYLDLKKRLDVIHNRIEKKKADIKNHIEEEKKNIEKLGIVFENAKKTYLSGDYRQTYNLILYIYYQLLEKYDDKQIKWWYNFFKFKKEFYKFKENIEKEHPSYFDGILGNYRDE